MHTRKSTGNLWFSVQMIWVPRGSDMVTVRSIFFGTPRARVSALSYILRCIFLGLCPSAWREVAWAVIRFSRRGNLFPGDSFFDSFFPSFVFMYDNLDAFYIRKLTKSMLFGYINSEFIEETLVSHRGKIVC